MTIFSPEARAGASTVSALCSWSFSLSLESLCGGREFRTPAFPIECVDSTGAGDAFHGGFVAACLRADAGDVESIMAYANAVAALNCRGLGARGGMPYAGEVEAMLMARSRA